MPAPTPVVAAAACLLAACATTPPPVPPPAPFAPAIAASAEPIEPPPEPEPPPTVTEAGTDAERVLFLATHLRTDELRRRCPLSRDDDARVRCLIALRYDDQPDVAPLALRLFAESGSLAGLLPEETSDQGPWGKLHLMPARPIGENRRQLEWILAAMREQKTFLEALGRTRAPKFTDRPVHFRFFDAENVHHPSAFAASRNIAWNVRGALNVSADAVAAVLFHETFHLNDNWHGRGNEHPWSETALGDLYARLRGACRDNACRARYAPTDTRIKGELYAFSSPTPREYAAEVALRYYREQQLLLAGEPLPAPAFRCGAPENAEAIDAIAKEFFGATEPAPACP